MDDDFVVIIISFSSKRGEGGMIRAGGMEGADNGGKGTPLCASTSVEQET